MNRRNASSIELGRRIFPEPPLQGNEIVVPITGEEELRAEGQHMEHCVAIYAEEVAGRNYYIYKVLAPERATLSVRRTVGGWVLSELRGRGNAKLSKQTQKRVLDWFQAAKNHSGRDFRKPWPANWGR